MAQGLKKLVPRSVVILFALLGIICALLIGFLAFFLPASRIRREYELATCTVTSASVACGGECRNVTVTSSSFKGRSTLLLSGRGTAPCESTHSCDDEFLCRFKQTAEDLVVRENVSAFPLGFCLFVALACMLILMLGMYLWNDLLQACGIDLTSRSPVYVTIFTVPGMDIPSLVHAITARWPRVLAKDLSYPIVDSADAYTATDKLQTYYSETSGDIAGLVVCVSVDSGSASAVLDSVPEYVYRVLLLPRVEDYVAAVRKHDGDRILEDSHMQHSHASEVAMAPTCEVEDTHNALCSMADRFDSVYTIGTLEFGRNSWIAMRAVSPYISARLALVSFFDRIANRSPEQVQ